jgi:hypothetical protein
MPSKLQGADKLQQTFGEFSRAGVGRLARSTLGAGITVVKRYQVKAAPKGKTGETRASVGRRLVVSRRTAFVTAKSGINVGRGSKAKPQGRMPHAFLNAIGSRPRFRKRLVGRFSWVRRPTQSQLRTGSMPVNNFIAQAYSAAQPAAAAAMQAAGTKALAREANRAKK